jgi:hypothetical protein
MSDPTLADVITRLDRLEAALHQLIDVVRGGARMSAPAPVASKVGPAVAPVAASGVAAAGEPPLISVAPPGRPVKAESAPVEEIVYDPYSHRPDIVAPGPEATVMQVLAAVFQAGTMAEPEDTWALMTKLTHPSQMIGPRALDHFKAFNWHKLRRTAATYLRDAADPTSFGIAYSEPGEIGPADKDVRVFVRAGEDRLPVPVSFARDPKSSNAWRVTMMSL